MLLLTRLVNVLFFLYALGLFCYTLPPLVRSRSFAPARERIGRFYDPPLKFFGHFIEPIPLVGRKIDLSPMFVFGTVVLAWGIVLYILIGKV